MIFYSYFALNSFALSYSNLHSNNSIKLKNRSMSVSVCRCLQCDRAFCHLVFMWVPCSAGHHQIIYYMSLFINNLPQLLGTLREPLKQFLHQKLSESIQSVCTWGPFTEDAVCKVGRDVARSVENFGDCVCHSTVTTLLAWFCLTWHTSALISVLPLVQEIVLD